MFAGLRVSAPVDTDEAVILGVVMIRSSGYCPAARGSVIEITMCLYMLMAENETYVVVVVVDGETKVNVIKK